MCLFTFQDFNSQIVTIEYMSSKDSDYIQSDDTISDLLSPTHSACRRYKPKVHKRKFQGNQHTLRNVIENNLRNESCLDEEEVVPMVPIS